MSQFFSLKIYTLAVLSFAIVGCTSLKGSFEERSVQLSQGIQRAYQVAPNTAQQVAPLIIQNSERYNLPPLTLAAMIQQESSYRPNVSSNAGAVGLMQIMPKYWQNSCPGNLYEIEINIACGSYILNTYYETTGNLKKALAYYNVGPNGYNNTWRMKHQGKRYAKQVKAKERILKKAL